MPILLVLLLALSGCAGRSSYSRWSKIEISFEGPRSAGLLLEWLVGDGEGRSNRAKVRIVVQ